MIETSMTNIAENKCHSHSRGSSADLQSVIEHVAHLLPTQGPITSFVHHNTLHAFEELPFEAAVKQAIATFDCQPYFSEERFRELQSSGRIRRQDLRSVLMEDLGVRGDELIGLFGTRFQLRLAMLDHPMRMANSTELRWLVAETSAMREFERNVSSTLREKMVSSTRQWAAL